MLPMREPMRNPKQNSLKRKSIMSIESSGAPVLSTPAPDTTQAPKAKRPRRTALEMKGKADEVLEFLSFATEHSKAEIQEATKQTPKEIEATLIKLSREGRIVASGTRGAKWKMAPAAKPPELSTDEKFAPAAPDPETGTGPDFSVTGPGMPPWLTSAVP